MLNVPGYTTFTVDEYDTSAFQPGDVVNEVTTITDYGIAILNEDAFEYQEQSTIFGGGRVYNRSGKNLYLNSNALFELDIDILSLPEDGIGGVSVSIAIDQEASRGNTFGLENGESGNTVINSTGRRTIYVQYRSNRFESLLWRTNTTDDSYGFLTLHVDPRANVGTIPTGRYPIEYRIYGLSLVTSPTTRGVSFESSYDSAVAAQYGVTDENTIVLENGVINTGLNPSNINFPQNRRFGTLTIDGDQTGLFRVGDFITNEDSARVQGALDPALRILSISLDSGNTVLEVTPRPFDADNLPTWATTDTIYFWNRIELSDDDRVDTTNNDFWQLIGADPRTVTPFDNGNVYQEGALVVSDTGPGAQLYRAVQRLGVDFESGPGITFGALGDVTDTSSIVTVPENDVGAVITWPQHEPGTEVETNLGGFVSSDLVYLLNSEETLEVPVSPDEDDINLELDETSVSLINASETSYTLINGRIDVQIEVDSLPNPTQNSVGDPVTMMLRVDLLKADGSFVRDFVSGDLVTFDTLGIQNDFVSVNRVGDATSFAELWEPGDTLRLALVASNETTTFPNFQVPIDDGFSYRVRAVGISTSPSSFVTNLPSSLSDTGLWQPLGLTPETAQRAVAITEGSTLGAPVTIITGDRVAFTQQGITTYYYFDGASYTFTGTQSTFVTDITAGNGFNPISELVYEDDFPDLFRDETSMLYQHDHLFRQGVPTFSDITISQGQIILFYELDGTIQAPTSQHITRLEYTPSADLVISAGLHTNWRDTFMNTDTFKRIPLTQTSIHVDELGAEQTSTQMTAGTNQRADGWYLDGTNVWRPIPVHHDDFTSALAHDHVITANTSPISPAIDFAMGNLVIFVDTAGVYYRYRARAERLAADYTITSGTDWETEFGGAPGNARWDPLPLGVTAGLLTDLEDVNNTGSLTDGTAVLYNNGTGNWDTRTVKLDDVGDATLTVIADRVAGDVLRWDGGNWRDTHDLVKTVYRLGDPATTADRMFAVGDLVGYDPGTGSLNIYRNTVAATIPSGTTVADATFVSTSWTQIAVGAPDVTDLTSAEATAVRTATLTDPQGNTLDVQVSQDQQFSGSVAGIVPAAPLNTSVLTGGGWTDQTGLVDNRITANLGYSPGGGLVYGTDQITRDNAFVVSLGLQGTAHSGSTITLRRGVIYTQPLTTGVDSEIGYYVRQASGSETIADGGNYPDLGSDINYLQFAHSTSGGGTPVHDSVSTLTDTSISSAMSGQILQFDGNNWINQPLPLYTDADADGQIAAASVGDLSDVDITSPADDQFLRYDGTNWINEAVTFSADLNGLTDVSLTSPADDQFLRYDGTNWINEAVDTDDITEGTGNLYYTDARADARIAAASVNALSDVEITSAADDQFLRHDGTNWVNESVTLYDDAAADARIAAASVGDLSNVSSTTATDGQWLTWNNTNSEWTPGDVDVDSEIQAYIANHPISGSTIEASANSIGYIGNDDAAMVPSADVNRLIDARFLDAGPGERRLRLTFQESTQADLANIRNLLGRGTRLLFTDFGNIGSQTSQPANSVVAYGVFATNTSVFNQGPPATYQYIVEYILSEVDASVHDGTGLLEVAANDPIDEFRISDEGQLATADGRLYRYNGNFLSETPENGFIGNMYVLTTDNEDVNSLMVVAPSNDVAHRRVQVLPYGSGASNRSVLRIGELDSTTMLRGTPSWTNLSVFNLDNINVTRDTAGDLDQTIDHNSTLIWDNVAEQFNVDRLSTAQINDTAANRFLNSTNLNTALTDTSATDVSGDIEIFDTDNITEGSTNLYYEDSRVGNYIRDHLADIASAAIAGPETESFLRNAPGSRFNTAYLSPLQAIPNNAGDIVPTWVTEIPNGAGDIDPNGSLELLSRTSMFGFEEADLQGPPSVSNLTLVDPDDADGVGYDYCADCTTSPIDIFANNDPGVGPDVYRERGFFYYGVWQPNDDGSLDFERDIETEIANNSSLETQSVDRLLRYFFRRWTLNDGVFLNNDPAQGLQSRLAHHTTTTVNGDPTIHEFAHDGDTSVPYVRGLKRVNNKLYLRVDRDFHYPREVTALGSDQIYIIHPMLTNNIRTTGVLPATPPYDADDVLDVEDYTEDHRPALADWQTSVVETWSQGHTPGVFVDTGGVTLSSHPVTGFLYYQSDVDTVITLTLSDADRDRIFPTANSYNDTVRAIVFDTNGDRFLFNVNATSAESNNRVLLSFINPPNYDTYFNFGEVEFLVRDNIANNIIYDGNVGQLLVGQSTIDTSDPTNNVYEVPQWTDPDDVLGTYLTDNRYITANQLDFTRVLFTDTPGTTSSTAVSNTIANSGFGFSFNDAVTAVYLQGPPNGTHYVEIAIPPGDVPDINAIHRHSIIGLSTSDSSDDITLIARINNVFDLSGTNNDVIVIDMTLQDVSTIDVDGTTITPTPLDDYFDGYTGGDLDLLSQTDMIGNPAHNVNELFSGNATAFLLTVHQDDIGGVWTSIASDAAGHHRVSLVPPGTTNQFLRGNGAGSEPSFENISASDLPSLQHSQISNFDEAVENNVRQYGLVGRAIGTQAAGVTNALVVGLETTIPWKIIGSVYRVPQELTNFTYSYKYRVSARNQTANSTELRVAEGIVNTNTLYSSVASGGSGLTFNDLTSLLLIDLTLDLDSTHAITDPGVYDSSIANTQDILNGI